MLSSSVQNNIPSRPKSYQSKHLHDDVIILDSDSDGKSSVNSVSKKRRLNNASEAFTFPNKRRSLSQNDSDCEIIEKPIVLIPKADGQNKASIRERPRDTADNGLVGHNIYANILTRPEIRIAKSHQSVNLDGGALRAQFENQLRQLQGTKVTVWNDIDTTSPPSDFIFINDNVLGEDVKPAPIEWMSGCSCRKENGRHMGCEHLKCECVQNSDPNESGRRYFPYSGAVQNRGCLRSVYLKLRNHIYECNELCNCENNCKNRLVQHGRQVPLEIFKTRNRGWGLRCPKDLLEGQFIDTYRGEVITNAEANLRDTARNRDQDMDNYLFALDKFCEPRTITKDDFRQRFPNKKQWHRELVESGDYEITKNKDGEKMYSNPDYRDPVYNIDSKRMGGPSRFVNHSCSPNCAIYTVSYNHADTDLYEVAFFATENIAAGTELTFDYKDDVDCDFITEAMADKFEQENGERPMKCLCGSEDCRGYFFLH